jgi:hypothetical protein
VILWITVDKSWDVRNANFAWHCESPDSALAQRYLPRRTHRWADSTLSLCSQHPVAQPSFLFLFSPSTENIFPSAQLPLRANTLTDKQSHSTWGKKSCFN